MIIEGQLPITNHLAIPASELEYRFVRSSGPGGQNVNKSATQVELTWDVAHSPSLTEEQRARIMAVLPTRIDREGVLHLTASSSRSQLANREEVTGRLQNLLRHALYVPRERHPTRPSQAAKERRLQGKKHRRETKRLRHKVPMGE
jgi:ribosome-associated protein